MRHATISTQTLCFVHEKQSSKSEDSSFRFEEGRKTFAPVTEIQCNGIRLEFASKSVIHHLGTVLGDGFELRVQAKEFFRLQDEIVEKRLLIHMLVRALRKKRHETNLQCICGSCVKSDKGASKNNVVMFFWTPHGGRSINVRRGCGCYLKLHRNPT